MSDSVEHVVIVGGGSAGWLTAAVLAAAHGGTGEGRLRLTVVESPDVPTIGVGEGTWPTMRDTLRGIGVSETDFMRECDASFKQGSRFDGWCNGGADDRYYHPFMLPQGYGEAALVAAWRARHSALPFADLCSVQPHLCAQDRAPKQSATPEFAAVANYAYHLDAAKFGLFLRKHCVERLGVRHLCEHVTAVRSAENGDIAALVTQQSGELSADLFVDCTGLSSLLLGQHFSVPLIPQRNILFNDRAIALQLPYADVEAPIAAQTISTAQRDGWVWDIGLPTRRGLGYVYSSAHVSDDQAEQTLLDFASRTPAGPALAAPRRLRFEPGYRQRFWHRNCVAIGLSAGFIEPLEASALALVELSAAMLSEQLPRSRAGMDLVAARFNELFSYRWERVIDFLKLHYVLSRRQDSAYWLDHRKPESVPHRLQELLMLWRELPPSRYDLNRVEEVFPSASYQYVLYGMGFVPESPIRAERPADLDRADHYFRQAASQTRRLLAGLPSNRELIHHVHTHGLPRS